MHDLTNNNILPTQETADNSGALTHHYNHLSDLPPADTKRWVVRRKEQVVQAVMAGRLTREEACSYYRLSEEEYQSWEDHLSQHGVRGLRVTRLQDYRRHEPEVTAGNNNRRRA